MVQPITTVQVNRDRLGLIGLWHMNEGTATSVFDLVSNNHGTIIDLAWVSSKFSFGLFTSNFGAFADDRITIANESNFDFVTNEPFSVSCWLKLDSYNTGRIISKGYDSGVANWASDFGLTSPNAFSMGRYSAGWALATYLIDDSWVGKWIFFVGTYDDTGTFRIYINGVKGTDSASGIALSQNDSPVTIGAWWEGTAYRYSFPGTVDEAAVYDRALLAAEIKHLYHRQPVLIF